MSACEYQKLKDYAHEIKTITHKREKRPAPASRRCKMRAALKVLIKKKYKEKISLLIIVIDKLFVMISNVNHDLKARRTGLGAKLKVNIPSLRKYQNKRVIASTCKTRVKGNVFT